MQEKLEEKEAEKDSEVPKYLPKEGTPAFAIVRALRNEIPHCLQKDELKMLPSHFVQSRSRRPAARPPGRQPRFY